MTKDDIEKIIKGLFNKDFFNAKLVPASGTTKISARGPCNVSMNSDGQLHLKMYIPKISNSILDHYKARHFGFGEPGTLINDERYCILHTLDNRIKWISGKILFTGDFYMYEGNNAVIKTEIREFGKRTKCNKNQSAKFVAVVAEKIKIPYNSRSESGSFDQLSLGLKSGKLKISTNELYTTIAFESNSNKISDKECWKILHALSFALGKELLPSVTIRTSDGTREEYIFSQDLVTKREALPAPLPLDTAEDAISLSKFIDCYCSTPKNRESIINSLWFNATQAWQAGYETGGLAVAIGSEGLIRELNLSKVKNDKKFNNEMACISKFVKESQWSERAKGLFGSVINNAKKLSVKQALRNLRDEGILTQDELQDWVSFRNTVAHSKISSSGNSAMQKDLDSTYSCLSIFYKLILHSISYSGDIRSYSIRGWPTAEFKKTK